MYLPFWQHFHIHFLFWSLSLSLSFFVFSSKLFLCLSYFFLLYLFFLLYCTIVFYLLFLLFILLILLSLFFLFFDITLFVLLSLFAPLRFFSISLFPRSPFFLSLFCFVFFVLPCCYVFRVSPFPVFLSLLSLFHPFCCFFMSFCPSSYPFSVLSSSFISFFLNSFCYVVEIPCVSWFVMSLCSSLQVKNIWIENFYSGIFFLYLLFVLPSSFHYFRVYHFLFVFLSSLLLSLFSPLLVRFFLSSLFSLSLCTFCKSCFSKFLPIFLFFLVLIFFTSFFRNPFFVSWLVSFWYFFWKKKVLWNKNCSSEEISSSLFLFRLFHCFPYFVPSLCFLLYLVCFFSNESFPPFSFTFLFLCFFRCMQLSVKEWKYLFSVLSQKKNLPFFARFLVREFFFLTKILSTCFGNFVFWISSFFFPLQCFTQKKTWHIIWLSSSSVNSHVSLAVLFLLSNFSKIFTKKKKMNLVLF